MAGLVMVAAVLAAIGYYLLLVPPATKVAKDASAAEVAAAAMLVYQKAAVDWCLRSTCADGPVPMAEMVLPPGYGQVRWLTSVAAGGRVSTYANPAPVSPLSIASSLGDLSAGGPSAGLASANGTVVARSSNPPLHPTVPIPAVIPPGAPVVSEKVK